MPKNKRMIKVQTIYGKILTIDVENETNTHIIGKDKFGSFVKLKKSDIDNSIPIREEQDQDGRKKRL